MYYLQTRYYNPEWGRFINADDASTLKDHQEQILSCNLFSYCYNNPTNYADRNGKDPYMYKYLRLIFIASALLEAKLNSMAIAVDDFTWHAVNRMVERGISPMTIINTIRFGDTYLDPANNYRTVYYRKGIAVVVEGRKIITVLVTRIMKRWLRY